MDGYVWLQSVHAIDTGYEGLTIFLGLGLKGFVVVVIGFALIRLIQSISNVSGTTAFNYYVN